MNRYVLTATLDGHTNAHTIKADDGFEATIEAIENNAVVYEEE